MHQWMLHQIRIAVEKVTMNVSMLSDSVECPLLIVGDQKILLKCHLDCWIAIFVLHEKRTIHLVPSIRYLHSGFSLVAVRIPDCLVTTNCKS